MLGATWRTYGQRYLAYWTGFWAAYLIVWPLFSLFYWAEASGHAGLAGALGGVTSLASFAGRACLVLGIIAYMEWRKPSRTQLVWAASVLVALAVGGGFVRAAIADHRLPGWTLLPFRSFSVGGLVLLLLSFLVLRSASGSQSMPRKILGLALLFAGLSDVWDFVSDLRLGTIWTEGSPGLRASLYLSLITFALTAAGMLVAAIGAERERAEKALEVVRQRDAQLDQVRKIEAAGKVAGGLAHDFNNLLTVIGASLDFIRARLDPGDPALQDVDAATLAADRAAKLTRQLLTFARRQKVSPRMINLNETMASIDRMIAALVGERVERRMRLGTPLWTTLVDPAQIEQLLVNLVVNSRDAMPRGGTLTIETAAVTFAPGCDRPPEARDVPDGDWVMLAVEDTGEGMSEATQKRIFEPFFTTKELGKGTGIGLATVYSIVREAGGRIGVRSASGEGSRFAVYLPRHDGAVAERAQLAPSVSRRGSDKETILVVENEAAVRSVAVRALVAHGYSVIEAAGGPEVLAWEREKLDAVGLAVVDIVMPEMDGRELARELRRRRPLQPVLFISGFVPDEPAAGRGEGPSSFLPKPFTPDQLVARVREMLDAASRAA